MKVQLTQRWGSHLPRAIVSVSPDRAKYLVKKLKIAKYVDQKKKPKASKSKSTKKA